MKYLLHKLLCLLFLHDFAEISRGEKHYLVGCRNCPSRWEVDMQQETMEPLKEDI